MNSPVKSWMPLAFLLCAVSGEAQPETPPTAMAGSRPASMAPGAGGHASGPTAPVPGLVPTPAEWAGWLRAAAKNAPNVASAVTPTPVALPIPAATNAAPRAESAVSILSGAERASLLRIGAVKLAAGDAESARIAYRQVAEISEDPEEEARALLGLARAYRLGGDQLKAAATYERLIKDHADHPEAPAAYLELGRTLRDLGSPKLAIASFYNVLQTAIKFPETGADEYRRLALTAQFEIAETHLATGNYAEAVRFFNRLNLLDLADADRARARFKSAQALALSGDRPAAVLALQAYIKQDPDDANSPEARFLLATILNDVNRRDDSLQVTLALLHHVHDRSVTNAGQWRTWQQRTGNQLANQFYTEGDFASALVLYKALAALDDQPAWRLPVLYQMALCHERLLQTKDALDIYRQIGSLVGDPPGEFAEIGRMAAWRAQQLLWWTQTQADLNTLITPPRPGLAATTHP